MKICAYCRAEQPDEVKICNSCGSKELNNICPNCGNVFSGDLCPQCGVSVGEQPRTCYQCGKETYQKICPDCGADLVNRKHETENNGIIINCYQPQSQYIEGSKKKSKIIAGLLGILFGGFGVHNFYLGFKKKAILQLVIYFVGGALTGGLAIIAVSIWGFIEGIMILCGAISKDARGIPL